VLDLDLEVKPEYELKPGQSVIDGVICEAFEGKWYDASTGEEVALVIEEGFRVKDEASANWVLSKYLDAEARILAVLGDPEVIRAKAILANAAALEKKARNSLAWLEARFKPELAEFAKTQLQGKKTKTWSTVLGGVSFRTVPGGLKVADEQKAIHWAETESKSLRSMVKVEKSFLISALPQDVKNLVFELVELHSEYLWNTSDEVLATFPDYERVDKLKTEIRAKVIQFEDLTCEGLSGLDEESSWEQVYERFQKVFDVFRFEPAKESVTIKTGVGK
jgi:hypothetical protein